MFNLYIFKPEGSHNGNDWLNNTHVDMIQEQLYRKFPDYSYSFIHMIDNIMIPPKNMKCINHPIKSITDIDFIDSIQKIILNGMVLFLIPTHHINLDNIGSVYYLILPHLVIKLTHI